MTNIKQNNTLILIIDIQEKLLNAVYNKETLSKNAEIIAKASNILKIPVLVTEQYPQGLGKTVDIITENLSENSLFFEKLDFSALNNIDLFKQIEKFNPQNILLFGIETHICVYQTAIDLLSKGFNVTLVYNLSGSRSASEHEAAINCLRIAGCDIKTLEMVLFEILASAKHPNFKQIQALIK